MSEIRYCLPIIVDRFEEALEIIDEQINQYHYFELWLDYLSNYSRDEVCELSKRLGNRLLLLFRRNQLDPIQMALEERLEVIRFAFKNGSYIDLDIQVQSDELKALEKSGEKGNLILSYHNYDGTPIDEIMDAILEKMRSYNPAIYKFSCFCKNRNDALRLLAFQRKLHISGYHSIVFGMGEKGVVTRVFAPLWGAEMVFAPVIKGKASAAGQLTKTELETIFNILNK